MKKITLLLIITLICSVVCIPATANENITVIIDGKTIDFDVAPVMREDRVLIPLRAVGEALGAYVQWEEGTQSILIGRRGVMQQLVLGNPNATIVSDYQEKETVLDVAPFTVNDRTMVPLRYVAENFQAKVDWDNDTNTVIITSNNPVVMTVNGIEITEGIYNYYLWNTKGAPDETLKIDFGFNKLAEQAGITMTQEDKWFTSGSQNEQEYEATKQKFIQFGLTEPEVEFLVQSIFYGSALYQKKETETTPAELKAFYESEFATVKHILLITENQDKQAVKAQAENILKQIKRGVNFDTLMKQYSQDPGLADYPEGYTFSKGEMTPAFEQAAFALEVGQVSDLVETDYGYHIIKRIPLETIPDDEIEALRDDYAYHFMMSHVEQMPVVKNQELLDSFNTDLRIEFLNKLYDFYTS